MVELLFLGVGWALGWATQHAYYRRSSTKRPEWANEFIQITQEIKELLSGTTREERQRRASSLIDSLKVLFVKSTPGGQQIDIIARVLEGDTLLAERFFTNISANTLSSPVEFKNLRIEVVAQPVGGGSRRQAQMGIGA